MTDARLRNRSIRGFTLVESIAVILLIGILAAISAVFIVQPFEAARDTTRRAELVDAAETALNRMTREIRLAVPNSVRPADIDGDSANEALEFLRSTTGGRYRRNPKSLDGSGKVLDIGETDGTFDVLGGLPGEVADGAAGRACADSDNDIEDCIVIYNTGRTDQDAYAQDNLAAITGANNLGDGDRTNDTLTFDTGGMGASEAFPGHSPRRRNRFQIIDTVVTYVCPPASDRIDRHHGYGLKETQVAQPAEGTVNELARDVKACEFTYDDGRGESHGLVTIDITIERDGETVRLIDQAHVMNVP